MECAYSRMSEGDYIKKDVSTLGQSATHSVQKIHLCFLSSVPQVLTSSIRKTMIGYPPNIICLICIEEKEIYQSTENHPTFWIPFFFLKNTRQ